MRATKQRGQSLIEASLVLLVFMTLLVGIMDLSQVVFAHQALNERVRSAVRWGSVHGWEGPEAIANLVLYDQPQAPARATEGFLGLKRENIEVLHRVPNKLQPDDDTLTVTIVNFEMPTFTPGFGGVLTSARPVSFTAPLSRQPDNPETAAAVTASAR